MKIPKSVKIGGHVYQIRRNHKFVERTDCNGLCSSTEQTIWLAYTQQDRERDWLHIRLTLLHEIVHAIDSIYNDNSLHESQVDFLSKGLIYILTHNDIDFNNFQLPKKLDAFGFVYKTIYPYRFDEYSESEVSSITDHSRLEICVSDFYDDKPKSFLAVNFLTHIVDIIECYFDLCEEPEGWNKRMSEGIYQVLKDNKKIYDCIKG